MATFMPMLTASSPFPSRKISLLPWRTMATNTRSNSTLYSLSTPMITETSTSTEVTVPEVSSEEPECSPSVVTQYVTVTQEAATLIEPSTASDTIEYSTVTEIHTAVSTIVKTLTNGEAVTVIETPIEGASSADGMSYSPPSVVTPITTETSWSTVTSGEPVTSTSYVVVTHHGSATASGSGINATVIVYPPGGGPEPTPSNTPGPVIVDAAPGALRASGVIFTACAVVAAVICLF